MRRRQLLSSTVGLFVSAAVIAVPLAAAASLPYDESADARAAVAQALDQARTAQVPVLIVFGANWCEDCRALDLALKGERTAAMIGREFRLVKVDVGNFNRNLDLDRAYGDPIRKGIPAAVLLAPDQKLLYATRAGELADARRMSDSGIYDFFDRLARLGRDR